MLSGSNSTKLFFFLSGVVLLLHFYTLNLFPLPWFDEVHFAGISKSLAQEGTLKSSFFSYTKGSENSLSYGPAFFALQAFSIKLFGFNMFAIRISTLLFGFVNIFLVYHIGIKVSKSMLISGLVSTCFLFDLYYTTTLHEGRMETLITSLFLLAILIIQSNRFTEITKAVLASILCVVSFLSSPRSFILILPLAAFLIYTTPKERIKVASLFLSIFLLPYLVWVIMAFNNLANWFEHYKTIVEGNTTAIHGYLGGNFYIPRSQYVLIFTAVLLTAMNFKRIKTSMMILFYSCIFLFYTLIHDWGNYSSLIVSIYYLALIFLIAQLPYKRKNLLFITPLLLFNLFYFSLKMGSSILEKENRSTASIEKRLAQYIKPNEKVIGDDLMMYIAEENQWDFQIFNHYKSLEEREEALRTRFKYDYLLVSKEFQEKKNQEVDYFVKKGDLILIDQFTITPHPIHNLLQKVGLSTMEKDGYSYYLYRSMHKK